MTPRFETGAATGGRTHRWADRRTYHHSRFPPERVAAEREATVSVCLPARNEAATIGPILECLMPLVAQDVVDQVVVVDDSTDGTGDIARACGAEVHDQSSLCAHLGPVQGKGDAMWRALSVLHGDVVCYLDADSERFGAHFAAALAGVVAIPGPVTFAKAFYRRPFRLDDASEQPTGGGRVTELTARPLLKAFYPELAAIRQPLAGEVDVRQNRHRPLEELGPMAEAVLCAVTDRLERDGRLRPDAAGAPWPERPPVASGPLAAPAPG
jgi:glucosyl-3-phosphoglycerate synthase